MSIVAHSELLSNIGRALQLDLEFDEHRQCFLLLDDDLMISIRSSEDSWIFYGMLGNLWDEEPDDAADITTNLKAQTLLALNLSLAENGGASIALEGSSGVAMLVSRVPTSGVDSQRMQEIIENFANQMSATLDGLRAPSETDESTDKPSSIFPPQGFFHNMA